VDSTKVIIEGIEIDVGKGADSEYEGNKVDN